MTFRVELCREIADKANQANAADPSNNPLVAVFLNSLSDLIALHFNKKPADHGHFLLIDTHNQDLRDSAVIDNLIGQIENIKNSDVKNYTNKAALRP